MQKHSTYSAGTRHRDTRQQPHNRPKLPGVEVIKEAIHRGRLEDFCREFLPGGRREGNVWRCGAVDGSDGNSFTMKLTGPQAGLGYEWGGSGQKYDIIDCIQANKSLTRAEALALARLRLQMPADELAAYVPRQKTPEELAREAEQKAKEVAKALVTWDQCMDVIGTAGQAYLRLRGIDQSLPTSLRFHPKLPYWETNDDGKPVLVSHHPALVCMVQRADGSFCGIQRIYLAEGGMGKAAVRSPKKARGDILGGAVRCCDDEDIRNGEVGITEGIENALSIPVLYDTKPAWAAVSAAGVAGIILPEWITHPTFYPDNDPAQRKPDGSFRLNKKGQPARPGPDAADEAVSRLKSKSCFPKVSLIRGGKDANAVLMAENGLVL